MTKDNVTGKNKDFYDLGKKIFDRLNPQGAVSNPQPLYTARTWQAIPDEEVIERANQEVSAECFARGVLWAEAKLKEKNG